MKRDIYIAIMVAAAKGRGIHLTEEEVSDLSMDDAIATRAANGLEDHEGPGWENIDPKRQREAGNRFV